MLTSEEIERRVKETDTPRSAKRSAAAQRVSKLATRHAEVAHQLNDIERELGEVIAESSDVIDIDELAKFTEVPASDLVHWLEAGKPASTKRKKPANTGSRGKKTTPSPKTTTTTTTKTAFPPRALAAAPTPTADSPVTSISAAQ